MAWQRWGERDPRLTEAFLRQHDGRAPFDPPGWRDRAAVACAILSGFAVLAFWVWLIRALL